MKTKLLIWIIATLCLMGIAQADLLTNLYSFVKCENNLNDEIASDTYTNGTGLSYVSGGIDGIYCNLTQTSNNGYVNPTDRILYASGDYDFSVGMWLYKPSYVNGMMNLHFGNNDAYQQRLMWDDTATSMRVDGDSSGIQNIYGLTGAWHHIVVTSNATSNLVSTYIDGALRNSSSFQINIFQDGTNGQEFVIGCNSHSSSGRTTCSNMSFDNFVFYNRTITSSEVAQLYAKYGNPFSPVPTISQTYVLTTPEETATATSITFTNYNITNSSTAYAWYNNTRYNGTITFTDVNNVTFSANTISPFAYLNTTQVNFTWNYTIIYSNGSNTTSNASQITQGVYWNLTKYPRVKINASDAINGSAVTGFEIIDATKSITTTNGDVYLWETSSGVYPVNINNTIYEYKQGNITFTSGSYGSYTFSLYRTNSITLNIYDEETGIAISDNHSITFTTNATAFTNYTQGASTFYIQDLTPNEYQITIEDLNSSAGYVTRIYTLTVSNRSYQVLSVYLAKNTSETIFTISDKDSGEYLENVLFTMYRIVNGSWQPIESKYSDITGKVQVSYQSGTQYKFYLSKTEYTDYIFYLNPILFSEYSVQMEKTSIVNGSIDYENIAVIYYPSSFNEGLNTFSLIIQSPYGILTNYGYTLTYPGGTNTTSGSNAIGSQLTTTLNISGATMYDEVKLVYYYTTSLSGTRTFTYYFPITITSYSNYTMMHNRDNTYGLGLFERVFITTLISIFVIGIGALIGQPLPALALALLVIGYLVYIGFTPIWAVIISIILGVWFLTWRSD